MAGYKHIVASKRAHRDQALGRAPLFVAETHGGFLSATATEIVQNIERGKWTASEVVTAYIARAALAHQATNCLTEVMFDTALIEAEALDREFAATGKLKGLLHSVPVSLKDLLDVKGLDTTIGFTQWADKPVDRDAEIVSLLRSQGAIIIAKTNVPQTMLAFECANPLWGRTTNPWNKDYTCGGSSGGEGALLAMDGSALGVGSDVGGSLRIPASYCGIYSLKPGAGRSSRVGARGANAGFTAIDSVLGPMARSVADLDLFCRATFGVQDRVNRVPPVPYRAVEVPKKMRFGYYTSDGMVKASPANQRAVLETIAALEKQGHECVEFEVPQPTRAMELFVGITSADGYSRMVSHLGPDPKEKSLFLVTLGPKLPGFLRSFAAWVVDTFIGDKIFTMMLRASRYKSVAEHTEYAHQKQVYDALFYREVWDALGFDAIIAPVQAVPVIPHGGCATLSPIACATILYNMVDSPVGIVPVTRASATLDEITPAWGQGPGHGSKMYERRLFEGKDAVYNFGNGSEGMEGMPVGVQIVGRRWEEEKVLGIMRVVDDALGERGFGPGCFGAREAK